MAISYLPSLQSSCKFPSPRHPATSRPSLRWLFCCILHWENRSQPTDIPSSFHFQNYLLYPLVPLFSGSLPGRMSPAPIRGQPLCALDPWDPCDLASCLRTPPPASIRRPPSSPLVYLSACSPQSVFAIFEGKPSLSFTASQLPPHVSFSFSANLLKGLSGVTDLRFMASCREYDVVPSTDWSQAATF